MPGTTAKVWISSPSGGIALIDDYNNPANWSPCGVPQASENIDIPVVLSNKGYPVVSQNGLSCHNVLVEHGATLTVMPGKTLNVTGTFTLQP
jgi:hypothetical protein